MNINNQHRELQQQQHELKDKIKKNIKNDGYGYINEELFGLDY
jgi:hypothetical protein